MSKIVRDKSALGLAMLLGVLAIAGIARAALQAVGPSGYHLVKTVKLGGAGGWDYLTVDSAAHRLFISRGTHFMVVDLAQSKIVGDIPDTQGAHGVALAAEFSRGYTTNGRTADSTIFDMATLKPPRRLTRNPARSPDRWRWAAGRNLAPRTARATSSSISKTRVRWFDSTRQP